MKRLFIKSKESNPARISVRCYGKDIILIYRLTFVNAADDEKNIGDGKVFSLTVTKICCGGERREVTHLHDISRRADDALRIFELVSRGLVTPCSAAEIVADIIGIYL